jgi:hypothetical protein
LPQGEHILAAESNHWIMQEQPDLIIAAIGKVARNPPDERRGSSAISTIAKS